MSIITENIAETTKVSNNSCVLSEILKSMQVSGSVLVNEAYLPPWSVAIPDATTLGKLLALQTGTHVVAFHYVKRGFIEIQTEAGKTMMVKAGEIALCFSGIAHQLTQFLDRHVTPITAIPVETILQEGNNPFAPQDYREAESTSVMCGVFILQNVTLNPILSSLPKLLHIAASHADSNLSNTLSWIEREIEKPTKSSYVIEKLLELLCAEVLRTHIENETANTGWFKSMKDPIVSQAITMIHNNPGDTWSVNKLAMRVAMSPSRFAARFTATLGDSPMAYLTKWRMNVAGRLLQETSKTVEAVASEVGYENVAAFSRAFKRHLGITKLNIYQLWTKYLDKQKPAN